MFYEYAVDPKCYADAEQIKRLAGEFGWCEGRLISNFPGTWLRKVKEAQDAAFKQLTIRQKSILTEEWEWLRKNKDKILINSGRSFDGNNDWISNAICQHKNKLFQAIIAHQKSLQHDALLIPSDLNAREPHWKIRHDDRILRTPESLCSCVSRLLQASAHIRFVDPYFNPTKAEWRNTLLAFIKAAFNNSSRIPILEYHLKIDKEIKSDIDEIKNGSFKLDDKKWYQEFKEDCQKYIEKILPKNREISLYLWCEIEPSNDWFHDRYVLTEKGGVRFEGLNQGRNEGQKTNVFRLSEELWKNRWNSLEKNSSEYKFLGTIVIPQCRKK